MKLFVIMELHAFSIFYFNFKNNVMYIKPGTVVGACKPNRWADALIKLATASSQGRCYQTGGVIWSSNVSNPRCTLSIFASNVSLIWRLWVGFPTRHKNIMDNLNVSCFEICQKYSRNYQFHFRQLFLSQRTCSYCYHCDLYWTSISPSTLWTKPT